MAYRIYRNLNKKCFSIQTYVKGKGWRVRQHATELQALNVTFKVYETGRQRCLRQKRKNVHAFAIAERIAVGVADGHGTKITYNPMVGPDFTIDHTAITWADHAELRDGQMFAVGSWR